MADVKWIKITTDIFDDEKILLIESLPEADTIITIWFKLLCLAGKQNNSGVFTLNDRIAYTSRMLAQIFRRKETSVEMALKTFQDYGMIEIIDGVITIPNWSKHQTLDQIEERREYMKNYMAEYREKQKQIACKTNCKVNSKVNVNTLDKEIELEQEKELDVNNNIHQNDDENKPQKTSIDDLFVQFWSAYPKKVERQKCYKWFKSHKPTIELVIKMLQAIKIQKNTRQWQDAQYIPYPYKWLNNGCWDDEVETTTPSALRLTPFEESGLFPQDKMNRYKELENTIRTENENIEFNKLLMEYNQALDKFNRKEAF